jgi:hypothetical protein
MLGAELLQGQDQPASAIPEFRRGEIGNRLAYYSQALIAQEDDLLAIAYR